MGEINCDGCGEQPYVAPLTWDYEKYHDFDDVPDVEMWCECPKDRAVVFTDDAHVSRPDYWGQSSDRFVCYDCGEMVKMITVTKGSVHPNIVYRLQCRCDSTDFGVGFGWREVMPDSWKCDMDPTKWPESEDEIKEVVDEHGPMSRGEVAEHVDVPEEGVRCLATRMQREDRLLTDGDGDLWTHELIRKKDEIVGSGSNSGGIVSWLRGVIGL